MFIDVFIPKPTYCLIFTDSCGLTVVINEHVICYVTLF